MHKYHGSNICHWAEIYEIHNEKRVISADYGDRFIKIYDFDTENLIKSFSIEESKDQHIFSFCLRNEKYILVGCLYSIKLFNIDEGKLIKEFNGLFSGWGVLSIFKFNHPILRDFLIANDFSGEPDKQGKINLLSIS
jgi:WD40 repeat protein